MVIEYLEKKSAEIANERDQVIKKLEELNLVIAENNKFIDFVESGRDKNLNTFSPVSLNPDSESRLDELYSEQKNLLDTQQSLKIKYDNLCQDYDESLSVIEIVKKHYGVSKQILNDNVTQSDFMKIKLLETQEAERQRIARDLHDSSVQTLTSLVHKTELCSKLIDMDPLRCKLELMVMSNTLRSVIQEMRNLIYNLRPMSFDDIGLDVTIDRELKKIEQQGAIHTKFVTEGEPKKLKQVIALTLLRIIQEACSNVLKYSKASQLTIKNVYNDDSVETYIIDDGIGFDIENYSGEIREDNSGFGLNNMKERVYLLSGTIDIKSTVGKGTQIYIKIPIKED